MNDRDEINCADDAALAFVAVFVVLALVAVASGIAYIAISFF